MHILLHSVAPTLQQATTDPRLRRRLQDTHRQVRDSLLWGHCSFLLGPGAQGSVWALQESISLSCLSSGSSMVGLMAASSKRAYAISRSAAPRAPVSEADHCRPVPPQETLKPSSISVFVGSLGVVHTRFVWALWASLAGMGLNLNTNSPLLPSCWGFSFALGREVSPHSRSNAYRLTGVSLTLDVGNLHTAGPAKHSRHTWWLLTPFHEKRWAGWITGWNWDCREKYQ